ncbi:MAG: GNAT family N-acetyltransferase [Planctomycetia bacterium]|jgi:ribosomal protein S18 acetylase RimI-like enzyme|nr:GNAT family N-acetyltransferase [Planctomycetia bacterium]
MAQADITIVTESQLPVIVELYNQIFRPPESENYFRRRFQGRYNVLVMLASLDNRPVGFCVGFELKPAVFYIWLLGVHADFRRKNIGRQLLESQMEWAKNHNYEFVRLEILNRHRAMMHLTVLLEYDIVGTRWDSMHADLLIQFEKPLTNDLR